MGILNLRKFLIFLRIPYDCSSYIHYYQRQGVILKKEVKEQADVFKRQRVNPRMLQVFRLYYFLQGCENGGAKFLKECLVSGGHECPRYPPCPEWYVIDGTLFSKEGYDHCSNELIEKCQVDFDMRFDYNYIIYIWHDLVLCDI